MVPKPDHNCGPGFAIALVVPSSEDSVGIAKRWDSTTIAENLKGDLDV